MISGEAEDSRVHVDTWNVPSCKFNVAPETRKTNVVVKILFSPTPVCVLFITAGRGEQFVAT